MPMQVRLCVIVERRAVHGCPSKTGPELEQPRRLVPLPQSMWRVLDVLVSAGTPWDSNWYEFVVNSFMPLWQTLAEEQLIDPDRYLTAKSPPAPEEGGFSLIQAREGTYASPWSYWFDFLTPQQWLLDQVQALPVPLSQLQILEWIYCHLMFRIIVLYVFLADVHL